MTSVPETVYWGAHSMSTVTSTSSQTLVPRVTSYALTVLLLTTVHHVYGAYVYHTPWRLHVAFISGVAAAATIGSVLVLRRNVDDVADHVAFWVFVGVTLALPVAAIGLFEGAYNHVLKDALYSAGASTSLMMRMFPPPAYELPNDAFFEITGVMQVVPASVTGWLLYRLVRSRWGVDFVRGSLDHDGSPGRGARTDSSEVIGTVGMSRDVHATRQVTVGDAVAQRTLTSVSGKAISMPDSHRLVHLQFRRFAGCPVCNLHLQSFSRREREIASADICEIIVFHSTPDDLRPYTADLPFAVIADAGKRLYLEFGVESSARALLDPRAWPAILRGIIHSFISIIRDKQPVPSLTPDGGRFGLPADFLIAPDGRVLARKYGNHADDQWSVEEVVALAREASRQRERYVNHRSETPSARTGGTSGYLAAE
jgi:peroxiredoxin